MDERFGVARRVPPVVPDAVAMVLLLALGLATIADLGSSGTGQAGGLVNATPVGALALVLGVVPVLFRWRQPLASTLVASVVYGAVAFSDEADRTALLVATLLCVYALASRGTTGQRRLGGSVVAVVAALGATVGQRFYADEPVSFVRYGLFEVALFGGTWLVGELIRQRRIAQEQLARRAERAEVRAETAAAGERARIARELHDLVGHAISVISVQATVGEHLAETDPAQAKQALGTIQDVSKQAMVEMRHLVGVLRSEDGGAGPGPLEPQPDAGDLVPLIDEQRAAGLDVHLVLTGADVELSPGLGLTAYRIVQEGLNNARKHAPGARIDVRLDRGRDALGVEVVNGPGTAEGRSAATVTGTTADELGSSGFGLVGIGERVAVYEGTLDAGPTADGGFRLRAVLPYGDEAPASRAD
ncbi:MAG: sensor histidine kinase [Acidimicrobiales bacterium]